MDKDRQIQEDVQQELYWEPTIDAANIGVAVDEGIVALTGEVKTFGQKFRAEEAALRVRGVRAVANDVKVELPSSREKSDADLAEDAVKALALHTLVPKDKIRIVVRNGTLSLDGEVDWQYQRRIAEEAVRDLEGVRSVVNGITVKPKIEASDVKRKVTAAFHRNAQIDADHVTVEVDGREVKLSGNVSSWAERREAERAAWAAPGVTKVRNEIGVVTRAPAVF